MDPAACWPLFHTTSGPVSSSHTVPFRSGMFQPWHLSKPSAVQPRSSPSQPHPRQPCPPPSQPGPTEAPVVAGLDPDTLVPGAVEAVVVEKQQFCEQLGGVGASGCSFLQPKMPVSGSGLQAASGQGVRAGLNEGRRWRW